MKARNVFFAVMLAVAGMVSTATLVANCPSSCSSKTAEECATECDDTKECPVDEEEAKKVLAAIEEIVDEAIRTEEGEEDANNA